MAAAAAAAAARSSAPGLELDIPEQALGVGYDDPV